MQVGGVKKRVNTVRFWFQSQRKKEEGSRSTGQWKKGSINQKISNKGMLSLLSFTLSAELTHLFLEEWSIWSHLQVDPWQSKLLYCSFVLQRHWWGYRGKSFSPWPDIWKHGAHPGGHALTHLASAYKLGVPQVGNITVPVPGTSLYLSQVMWMNKDLSHARPTGHTLPCSVRIPSYASWS